MDFIMILLTYLWLLLICSSSYWVHWTMTGGHSHSVTYHAVWGLLSSLSMSKRYNLRSSSMADDHDTPNMEDHKCILDSDSFRIHLLESLSDDAIASKLQCIFTPFFNRLTEAVNDLVKTSQSLKQQLWKRTLSLISYSTGVNIWSPKWMTWSSWVVEGLCGYKGFRSKALARSRRKLWPSATGPLNSNLPSN